MITINGYPLVSAHFVLPRCGVWTVSGEAATDTLIEGPVVITDSVAARSLVGTVRLSRVDGARCVFDVVGGAGGWSRTVPAKGYHNDAGVKKSIVLADAARECGETPLALPTGVLEAHYARRNAPASSVLHDLFPGAWRLTDAGLTEVGAVTSSTYDVETSVVTQHDYAGCVSIAADTLAGLAPGLRYGGLVYGDIEIVLNDKIHATAYATVDSTGIFARLVAAAATRLRYAGVTSYRVVSVDADRRCNLQPVNASSLMPQLTRVPYCGVAGVRGSPTPGSRVLVAFADASPTKPVIIGGDDAAGLGWGGSDVELGSAAGELDPVAKATPVAANIDAVIQAAATMVGALSVDAPSATAAASDFLAALSSLDDIASSDVQVT